MYDKILETKKEMKKILKRKDITRLEMHSFAVAKSNELSETERVILLNECRRDIESYNTIKDIKEIVTVLLTGIGLILTVYGILFKNKVMDIQSFINVENAVAYIVCISILILYIIQTVRNYGIGITKKMIDILEKY